MGAILNEQDGQGGARQSLGGMPHAVDTIAVLRQGLATDLFGQASVAGGTTVGDGGGGSFWWNSSDTTADNGTTVIRPAIVPQSSPGRWNLLGQQLSNAFVTASGSPTPRTLASRFADIVNVKNFGALCDGTTDDTVAIQAAIDSLSGVSTRTHAGIVFIPWATVISATLILKNKSVTIVGTGWGTSAEAPLCGYIKWNGIAGIPMLKISDAFGAGVENIRFIGNSLAKPSAAIEINQGTVVPQTNMATTLRRIWIGSMYGLDTDFANQFTAGITFTGSTNGDSNSLNHIRITGCDDYGIDVVNPNASDIGIEGLFIQFCGVGLRTAGTVSGNNWLFTNSVIADTRLVTGGKIYAQQMVCESSARLCLFDGNNTKLCVKGGSWQASIAKIASDGIILDVQTASAWVVQMEDFALQFGESPYLGPIPTFVLHRSSGATTGCSVFINTWGIYPANLDFGSVVWSNDARSIVYRPAQENGQDPMPSMALALDWTKAADRAFQVWRNDLCGKLNVFGGELVVAQLASPLNTTATPTGSGATTYSYRVTALTYAGETLAAAAATCVNAAELTALVYNTVRWNPVQGAYAYKIYGRSSGTELLMATLTWNDQHPGNNSNITPPRWVDDGSATPSGALPAANTTGRTTLEGGLTFGGSVTPTAGSGQIAIGGVVASTVGAAGGASALPATPTGYVQISIGGVLKKIAYYDN